MAVVAVLISVEIFVYKLLQIRKEQKYVALPEAEVQTQPASDPAEVSLEDDGLADIPPFTLSLDTVEDNTEQAAVSEMSEPEVQTQPTAVMQNADDTVQPAVVSGSSVQDIPASDFLYDAQGNPQMRILYDSKGNPVYVPLQK